MDNMSLPTPYYQDDTVTIYHADCRDILPLLPEKSVDLVLTDPPFVNLSGDTKYHSYDSRAKSSGWSYQTVGDTWNATLDWMPMAWRVASLGMMVFCTHHSVAEVKLAISAKVICLFTWYKRNTPPSGQNAPHFSTEFIWAFQKNSGLHWKNMPTMYDIPKLSTGALASAERVLNGDGSTAHPTQKPVELLAKLLQCTESTHSVLDPFLGSGTTAFAAKKLGHKCIGIEIEEKYCEIAAKRCSQSVMALEIPPDIPKQQGIPAYYEDPEDYWG